MQLGDRGDHGPNTIRIKIGEIRKKGISGNG